MHKIGPQPGDQAAEERIRVQMKIPVQHDRGDVQGVARGVLAFERLPGPARGHDDVQVEALGGEELELALVRADHQGLREHEDTHVKSIMAAVHA
jgi:hypothetical protein